MATHKFIYWYPQNLNVSGESFANIHLLVGYNQTSIADFREMANELRETFPQATDNDIQGGRVFKSSLFFGYSIITWSAYIPKGEYPGWNQTSGESIEYFW